LKLRRTLIDLALRKQAYPGEEGSEGRQFLMIGILVGTSAVPAPAISGQNACALENRRFGILGELCFGVE
jgi:hypothetical protein